MALKIDTKRKFTVPVPVTLVGDDGVEQSGTFQATFKVVPQDEFDSMDASEKVLDHVLVDVADIEITHDGEVLQGKALIKRIVNDPTLSSATLQAYFGALVKKT